MFDDDFKPYLIEANTNPCLETPSPFMARLIPTLVENMIRIAVDPMFPAPDNFSQNKKVL
jgi:tubulin monoglycylase TTLL3/8